MKIFGSKFHERSLQAAAGVQITPVAASPAPPARGIKTGLPQSGSTVPNFLVPSVQARWLAAGVSWYTPQMVETIFRLALSGDLQSQWEMFDLMQATWPELSKCLNELKDGVCDFVEFEQVDDPHFDLVPFALRGEPPSDEAQRRASVIQEALLTMRPRNDADENDLVETVRDLLDARGCGIAVLEIDWELRALSNGSALCPRATRWVHPSWYGYPFGPGNEQLWLKLGGLQGSNAFSPMFQPLPMGGNLPPIQSPTNFYSAVDFCPFPPNKFIIAVCKQKSGHPLGGALLHILAWYWSAMNFSLEWFLNFAQIFGQPFRWANYDPELSDPDQAKLLAMLAGMGAMGYAMFPAGTESEFKEATGRAADNPQKAIIDIANQAARLLILRQSLTSEGAREGGGGSRALGEVQERVLSGVVRGAGKWAAKQLQQLVRSICLLNFGDDRECPILKLLTPDEDQSKETSETLANLKTAGLQPTDDGIDQINSDKRLGFEVERAPVTAPAPADEGGDGSPSRPSEGNIAASASLRDHPSDLVASEHAPALAAALRGAHAPLREILLTSSSKEEALARATKMYSDWQPARVRELIDGALQQCAQKALGN